MSYTSPSEIITKFSTPDEAFASITPEDTTVDSYVKALNLESLDDLKTLMCKYKDDNLFAQSRKTLSGAMIDFLIEINCYEQPESINTYRHTVDDSDDEATIDVNDVEPQDSDDNLDEAAVEAENVLEDLCEMFKSENGRDPTEEEMKQWIAVFQSLSVSGCNDNE